jgi:hypothetical protein
MQKIRIQDKKTKKRTGPGKIPHPRRQIAKIWRARGGGGSEYPHPLVYLPRPKHKNKLNDEEILKICKPKISAWPILKMQKT